MRPQRGSRAISTTGESARTVPCARTSRPMTAETRSTRSASKPLAMAMACGKLVASAPCSRAALPRGRGWGCRGGSSRAPKSCAALTKAMVSAGARQRPVESLAALLAVAGRPGRKGGRSGRCRWDRRCRLGGIEAQGIVITSFFVRDNVTVCATFSSSVIRLIRSRTRRSMGCAGILVERLGRAGRGAQGGGQESDQRGAGAQAEQVAPGDHARPFHGCPAVMASLLPALLRGIARDAVAVIAVTCVTRWKLSCATISPSPLAGEGYEGLCARSAPSRSWERGKRPCEGVPPLQASLADFIGKLRYPLPRGERKRRRWERDEGTRALLVAGVDRLVGRRDACAGPSEPSPLPSRSQPSPPMRTAMRSGCVIRRCWRRPMARSRRRSRRAGTLRWRPRRPKSFSAALPGRVPDVTLATTADADVARLDLPTADLGEEGILVRAATLSGRSTLLITGNSDRGLLYGAFALLRHLDSGGSARAIDLKSRRASSCGCSINGTISMALSSVAMRAGRCGTGGRCPNIETRCTPTMRGPMLRSASTAPC